MLYRTFSLTHSLASERVNLFLARPCLICVCVRVDVQFAAANSQREWTGESVTTCIVMQLLMGGCEGFVFD